MRKTGIWEIESSRVESSLLDARARRPGGGGAARRRGGAVVVGVHRAPRWESSFGLGRRGPRGFHSSYTDFDLSSHPSYTDFPGRADPPMS